MLWGELPTRNARRNPERTAIVFGDIKYTFKEFNDLANRLANGLGDIGVRRGDRVAVLADDCPEHLVVYAAATKGGTMVVPINPMVGEAGITYVINNAEANTLLFGQNYRQMVDSICGELGSVRYYIPLDGEGKLTYQGLIDAHSAAEPKVELEEGEVVGIMFTSGTTGLPKGTMLTHKGILANARSSALSIGMTPSDTMLNVAPCFSFATGWALSLAQYVGGVYAAMPRFAPEKWLEMVQRERATIALLMTPYLISVLGHPDISKYDLSSLRLVACGGTAPPADLLKKAVEVFGPVVGPMYGLTEASGSIAYMAQGALAFEGAKARRALSCGKEMLDVEIKVVDDDGNFLPPAK